MGRTRDLFKKTGHIKEILHARMGTIKDRNGMDLTEAEDIKKRWQEYMEELYKKDLNDPDNGSVTQSCLTLCDPVDCSPPGSSVHGIFLARVLEWIVISYSRGSS